MLKLRRNSLQMRILVLFLALDIILSGLLAVSGILNTRRIEGLYDVRVAEEKSSLIKRFEDRSALTKAMVSDYSVWDDTYEYLLGNLPEYPELNISEDSLGTFDSDVFWLYKKDFSIATSLSTFGYTPSLEEKQEKIIQSLKNDYIVNFYMKVPEGLLEIYGTTVVRSDDYEHANESSGYLFVGRLVTNDSLAELQDRYLTSLVIIEPEEISKLPPRPSAREGILKYDIEKTGIDGEIVSYVHVTQEAFTLREMDHLATRLLWFNGLTFLTLILVTYYVAKKWVIVPLNTVYDGLESGDTSEIKQIMGNKTEFSRIALLINSFFEQQDRLKNETIEKELFITKLEEQDSELAKTNEAMIGRELKMIELKQQISELKKPSTSREDNNERA